MIDKIQVTDTNVIELIRSQMPLSTKEQKGLLDANSNRYVKSVGLSISKNNACIKLYSTVDRTTVTVLVTAGRIEGALAGLYLMSFSMATIGTSYAKVKKLNNGIDADFYYVKNGNQLSIYLVTSVDFSVTNISPLLESGNYTYHLTEDTLPEDAVKIEIE